MEYGIYGDLIMNIPEAIFYLLKGDYMSVSENGGTPIYTFQNTIVPIKGTPRKGIYP